MAAATLQRAMSADNDGGLHPFFSRSKGDNVTRHSLNKSPSDSDRSP